MGSKKNREPKPAPTVRKFGNIGTYIEKVDTIEHLSNAPEGKRLHRIEAQINELAEAVRSDDRLKDAAGVVAEQLALAGRALSRRDVRTCESTLQHSVTLVGDDRRYGEALGGILAEVEALPR